MTDITMTDRNKALNAASNAANKRLKEAHPDEWNGYMKEEASKRGQPWTPKPDAKAKAKADFERLLAEHPEFADELRVVETKEFESTPPPESAA